MYKFVVIPGPGIQPIFQEESSLPEMKEKILQLTDTAVNTFHKMGKIKIIEAKTHFRTTLSQSGFKTLKKIFSNESDAFCFVCYQLNVLFNDIFYKYKKNIENDKENIEKYIIQFFLECVVTKVYDLNKFIN